MSRRRVNGVLFRDVLIFQVKLALDGAKDIVLMPLSLLAAGVDVLFPGPRPGHRFYAVIRIGEKYDRWLNLFGAASEADARRGGLFGASRSGSDSLLGRLEAMATGEEESDSPPPRRTPRG
jgi:hypothetical protein